MPTLLAVTRNIAVFDHLKWGGVYCQYFFQKGHKRAFVEGEVKTRSKINIERLLHYEDRVVVAGWLYWLYWILTPL